MQAYETVRNFCKKMTTIFSISEAFALVIPSFNTTQVKGNLRRYWAKHETEIPNLKKVHRRDCKLMREYSNDDLMYSNSVAIKFATDTYADGKCRC